MKNTASSKSATFYENRFTFKSVQIYSVNSTCAKNKEHTEISFFPTLFFLVILDLFVVIQTVATIETKREGKKRNKINQGANKTNLLHSVQFSRRILRPANFMFSISLATEETRWTREKSIRQTERKFGILSALTVRFNHDFPLFRILVNKTMNFSLSFFLYRGSFVSLLFVRFVSNFVPFVSHFSLFQSKDCFAVARNSAVFVAAFCGQSESFCGQNLKNNSILIVLFERKVYVTNFWINFKLHYSIRKATKKKMKIYIHKNVMFKYISKSSLLENKNS